MDTYWHWLRDDGRLQFGSKEKVEVGKTLAHEGEVVLCASGFHASKEAIDALQYAPGSLICCVALGGKVVEGNGKVVAEERTVLWMADATKTLYEFACWCAEESLRTAKVEDVRCWAAIETKRKWLRGEATDAELDAAWDAARGAARVAARAAARGAAWAAARGAARAAARGAAWAAAWDAARVAARVAAWAAARGAAWAAAWNAAWDAARVAAWDAARVKQNARLTEMLMELKPQT